MHDSVTVAALPDGAGAYAGYVDGKYANIDAIRARFPNAHVLSIAVSASSDADCLDFEQGDAAPHQAPEWVQRQFTRGLHRPIVYASQSVMPQVLGHLADAGIARPQVRVWTAHYESEHVCAPESCNAAGFTADGTQWIDHGQPADGKGNYDESILAADFFAPVPTPFQEEDMWTVVAIDGKGQSWAVNGKEKFKLYIPAQVADGQRLGYFRPGPWPLAIDPYSLDRMVEVPTVPPNQTTPTQPYGKAP
jgi:hypothetical protein